VKITNYQIKTNEFMCQVYAALYKHFTLDTLIIVSTNNYGPNIGPTTISFQLGLSSLLKTNYGLASITLSPTNARRRRQETQWWL